MCRWAGSDPDVILRSTPDWRSFARLVFSPVLRRFPGLPDDVLEQELLGAIHRGEVMLILDALDELATDRDQHVHFFEGIRALLDLAGTSATRFRCLVSMRFEYISAVDTPSGAELVNALRKKGGPLERGGVHFLHMDFLNDSWVDSYLRHTSSMESLVEALQQFPSFYELLHRPIFLQMAGTIDESTLEFKISELGHPVQLVRAFVKIAEAPDRTEEHGPYFGERDAIALESGYRWNTRLMARRALAQYEKTGGNIAFSLPDIESFLVPVPGTAPALPLDRDRVLLSVQKCPFLHQFSEDTVAFSHKLFLEYFVSRGIVLDLDESGAAFDRLVLNSDMRYFLRFLVDEKYPVPEGKESEWYRRTRKSYALDEPDAWSLSGGRNLADISDVLDKIRKTLLNSMTEPRNFDSETARTAIRDFFKYERDNLHPRYLMYNYEAVAVYLWRHRWQEDDLWLLHEFEDRLTSRARDLFYELDTQEIVDDREGHELLVERMISIARRLQMDEILQIPFRKVVHEGDIQSRMNAREKTMPSE